MTDSPAVSGKRRHEVLKEIGRLAASIGLRLTLTSTEIIAEAKQRPPPARRSVKPSEPPVFQLTERDRTIIRTVNRYRYLRTGQMARLLFPANRSRQSVQRRLRLLSHPGHAYLLKISPAAQTGKAHSANDTAYFLGPAGIELLEHEGEEVHTPGKAENNHAKPTFLEHALDLAEFRVKLELALHQNPLLALHRFTMDFELKEQIGQDLRRKSYKYKLHHTLLHPRANKSFIVYPDALIILRGRGELESQQRLFFLEIDRGSMSLGRIRDKIIGYQLFLEQGAFQKYGAFDSFRVLLQTNSPRRAENIRAALVGIEGETLVWVTDEKQVTEPSILNGHIWLNAKNRRQCIITTKSTAPPPVA